MSHLTTILVWLDPTSLWVFQYRFAHSNIKMLHPILFISIIVLAKLNCGEGLEYGNGGRYGTPSLRRFGSFGTAPSPSARPLTPTRSGRFDESMFSPQQQSLSPFDSPPAPSPLSSRPYLPNSAAAASRGSRFPSTASGLSPAAPSKTKEVQEQNYPFDLGSLLGGGDGFPSGFMPSTGGYQGGSDGYMPARGGYASRGGRTPARGNDDDFFGPASGSRMMVTDSTGRTFEVPPGLIKPGEALTQSELDKRLKRYEEEQDPDSHTINTTGEVIEKETSQGGQIVVKISGTNISQRKMKKLRQLLTDSVELVFEHPEFKTGLISRFV